MARRDLYLQVLFIHWTRYSRTTDIKHQQVVEVKEVVDNSLSQAFPSPALPALPLPRLQAAQASLDRTAFHRAIIAASPLCLVPTLATTLATTLALIHLKLDTLAQNLSCSMITRLRPLMIYQCEGGSGSTLTSATKLLTGGCGPTLQRLGSMVSSPKPTQAPPP